ncbi:MAG: bactofilin family protein [Bacteroidota bacterium]
MDNLVKEQNKIAQGTVIKGDIESKGSFRIEGKVEGSIKTLGKVVIGKTGYVEGSIQCENADFEGKFSGEINVNSTLSLKSTATVEGDVSVDKLSIEPGAVFNATCKMKGAVKSLNEESKSKRKGKKEQTA